MKYYIIALALLLTGCSTTVPVARKFPDAPAAIVTPCPALNKIQSESASIVDLHRVVVENYTLYHECSIKVDAWNEWYQTQRRIFEEVK